MPGLFCGRSLVHADGSPFFWLGDTAWMMIHRASESEVNTYFQTRAAQRFNVTLQVALGEIGTWNQPTRQGRNLIVLDLVFQRGRPA